MVRHFSTTRLKVVGDAFDGSQTAYVVRQEADNAFQQIHVLQFAATDNVFQDDCAVKSIEVFTHGLGMHTYVWMDWRTGQVTRRELGYMGNEAERAVMTLTLNDIKREAVDRYIEKEAAAKREEERTREKEMKAMTSVEPIQIGGKWGLRSNGRMVIPPMYRNILMPVGKYCAVESCPGIWGVRLLISIAA